MSDLSELATNIHRLSTVLGKVADTALQECCGFGTSQYKILWMLHKHPEGVLQTNIAQWLNLTEAAVSRQIALLDSSGLIVKQVDPKNRRNNIIMLSGEGKKCAENAMQSLLKAYGPHFNVLTEKEQSNLNTLLEKIFFNVIKNLHKEGK